MTWRRSRPLIYTFSVSLRILLSRLPSLLSQPTATTTPMKCSSVFCETTLSLSGVFPSSALPLGSSLHYSIYYYLYFTTSLPRCLFLHYSPLVDRTIYNVTLSLFIFLCKSHTRKHRVCERPVSLPEQRWLASLSLFSLFMYRDCLCTHNTAKHYSSKDIYRSYSRSMATGLQP